MSSEQHFRTEQQKRLNRALGDQGAICRDQNYPSQSNDFVKLLLLQKSFFKKFYFKNKNFKKSTSIFKIPKTSSRPGTFATAKKYATKIANIFTNFYMSIVSVYKHNHITVTAIDRNFNICKNEQQLIAYWRGSRCGNPD